MATLYAQFRAEASVAVGETFIGEYNRTFSRPRVGEVPNATFTVTEVAPEYYDRRVTVDLRVALDTPDGERVAGINRPHKDETLSFLVKDIDI